MKTSELGRYWNPAYPASARTQSDKDVKGRNTALSRLAVGLVGLQIALPAGALGIGEPQHVSRLFEPLRVDIPIDSELKEEDLRVRLMIRPDEDGSGLVQPPPGLRQEFVANADGQRVLRVTTLSAIREPMLTLHVDLAGPGVQIRRDLTLLFDPPAPVSSSSMVASAAASTAAEPRTPATPAPVADAGLKAISPAPRTDDGKPVAPRASRAARQDAREGSLVSAGGWRMTAPVREGETLEQIADRLRPTPDTSIATMAMLLKWSNPRAFEVRTGKLRVGTRLKIPVRDELEVQLAAFAALPAGQGTHTSLIAAAQAVGGQLNAGALQLADQLSTRSLQVLVTVANGIVPTAQAATPAISTTGLKSLVVDSALGTFGALPPSPLLAASASSPTVLAQAIAGPDGIAIPQPTMFPAWLMALVTLLGGGMTWALGRVLRNTPVPAGFVTPAVKAATVEVGGVTQPLTRTDAWTLFPATTSASMSRSPQTGFDQYEVDRDDLEAIYRERAPDLPAAASFTPEQFDLTRGDPEEQIASAADAPIVLQSLPILDADDAALRAARADTRIH